LEQLSQSPKSDGKWFHRNKSKLIKKPELS